MADYFCKETLYQMFDWVLNAPLLPVKNKEKNYNKLRNYNYKR